MSQHLWLQWSVEGAHVLLEQGWCGFASVSACDGSQLTEWGMLCTVPSALCFKPLGIAELLIQGFKVAAGGHAVTLCGMPCVMSELATVTDAGHRLWSQPRVLCMTRMSCVSHNEVVVYSCACDAQEVSEMQHDLQWRMHVHSGSQGQSPG